MSSFNHDVILMTECLIFINIQAMNEKGHHLKLRNLQVEDYGHVKEIMDHIYHMIGGAWTRSQFNQLLTRFPEGQICIEDNGRVVAAALTIIVSYSDFGDRHKYDEITGQGNFNTHDPEGDTLYGVDVFVDPAYRGLRLGRRLYDARKEICEQLNLRRIIVGGRIPGYTGHAGELSPQEYITRVKGRELSDPVLSFQLSNEFHIRRVVKNYLPDDHDSKSYAVILEWNNIFYESPSETLVGRKKPVVRIGVVQWQMRRIASYDELFSHIEYFVDAIAGYNSDFILFPEFFNAPLMALSSAERPSQGIRDLAEYTERMREDMQKLALSYNINIIGGSMPYYEDGALYNVSYLLRRDGTSDYQKKLHITPDEAHYWGVTGGDKLKVFDTDIGKIGILVCYDVEFPELPRLLAQKGIKILFVPYWTDTRNAYLRVRRCAQARAIENECYVATTGSVGNLPNVDNMDIQYSQAAVFTPSDYAFPHDAIAAEATPNTEVTLVADLDLELLKELRMHGSVRNQRERRNDLYRIQWIG